MNPLMSADATSTHGWRLFPPVAWLGPLTAAQKARAPLGHESCVVEPTGEMWVRLARRDACWSNFNGRCIKPDARAEAYRRFHAFGKDFTDDDGRVVQRKVGVLAFDTGHAPDGEFSFEQLMEFYFAQRGEVGKRSQRTADNVQTAFAHGVIEIDDDAIWFHGAVAPHRSVVEVVLASSAAVSGEWLRSYKGGPRELAGITLVNLPAYRSDNVDEGDRRVAASVYVDDESLDGDGPDRIVTFGDGWSTGLLPLVETAAVYDATFEEQVNRVAASTWAALTTLKEHPMETTVNTNTTQSIYAPNTTIGVGYPVTTVPVMTGQLTTTFVNTTAATEVITEDQEEEQENPGPANAEAVGLAIAQTADAGLIDSIGADALTTVPKPRRPAQMHWRAVLGVEGIRTTDGRLLTKGSITWRDLPLPLRYAPEGMGHEDASPVGTIWTIGRAERPDGAIDVWAEGTYYRDDPTGLSQNVEAMVAQGVMWRLSMDPSSAEYAIVYDELNHPQVMPIVDNGVYIGSMSWPYRVFTQYELAGVTVVDIPALAQAAIQPIEAFDRVAASMAPGAVGYPVDFCQRLAREMRAEGPGVHHHIDTINEIVSEPAARLRAARARIAG